MKILITSFLIVTSTFALAQKDPIKFGEVPLQDLEMVKYDKDSSAEAVVLADYGVSSLKYTPSDGFSLVFNRIIRLKVLTKEGLDWATFTVPLYHDGADDEKLGSLKAVTYNLENKKIVESKLRSDAVFKEKVNDNVNQMKFTLPNVRAGSVLEVSYRVTSDFFFNFQDWEFQRSIPTRWSEYRAEIPEFYFYQRFTQGYVGLTINESKQVQNSLTATSGAHYSGSSANNNRIDFIQNNYRWAIQDVPAFKIEPYMTCSQDYISKINFELAYEKFPNQLVKSYMGTWADINKLYDENDHFGKEITGNGYLKKLTEEITKGLTTPDQKINAINNYVRNNIEWNGTSRKYTDESLKKVLEGRKGSSSEINLLMASLLEKAGIDVSPVLISTRDHGFLRESVPVSSQFNYVLCMAKAGDKTFLLDATDKFLTTGALPERCLNGMGFVVSPKGFSWIPLTSNQKSRTLYNADLSLNADGELKGKIKVDQSGYFAQSGRKNYVAKGESDYIKQLIGNRPWVVAKSEFINAKVITESFQEIHDIVINDHVTYTDAVIYFNPFVALQLKENPFKTETRQYPVDFGSPEEVLYMCKIIIPDGYGVDELPQSKLLKLPANAAKYTYNMTQSGNTVTLTSHLQINNSLFSQDEYPNLREFYNQVVAKQAEQIVLKKK
ncbi:MAG: transglutaminase domain-containing protein [Chryseolinea sp.]